MNQYTGAPEEDDASNDHDTLGQVHDQNGRKDPVQDYPIAEEDNLPEERFHRADIVSQHMIDTRERQRKEKVSTQAVVTAFIFCRFVSNLFFRFPVHFYFCLFPSYQVHPTLEVLESALWLRNVDPLLVLSGLALVLPLVCWVRQERPFCARTGRCDARQTWMDNGSDSLQHAPQYRN